MNYQMPSAFVPFDAEELKNIRLWGTTLVTSLVERGEEVRDLNNNLFERRTVGRICGKLKNAEDLESLQYHVFAMNGSEQLQEVATTPNPEIAVFIANFCLSNYFLNKRKTL